MKCNITKLKRFANLNDHLMQEINNDDFKFTYRKSDKDFTRNRKLGFVDYIIMGLMCGKSNLQTNINYFLREKSGEEMHYSKQAYSKGRQRIIPEAFKHLIDTTSKAFYEIEGFKVIKNYLLLAIDGSDFNLLFTPELKAFFGAQKTNSGEQVQALTSTLYDVLNGIVLEAEIEPYNSNERTLALKHLTEFRRKYKADAIITMDRGYPSFDLMCEIEHLNLKYLMRCNKNNFLKEIRDTDSGDKLITIERKGKEISVRVITVTINGNEHTFITNLSEEEFTTDEIAQLYRLRWGIETLYKKLKCKMETENFSGRDVLCIKQDYFASIVLSNIVAAAVSDSQYVLNEELDDKQLTRHYKVNNTSAISEIKSRFIMLMCLDSVKDQQREYDHILNALLQNTVAIQPGRSSPRTVKHKCNKYPLNNKRTLL